MIALFMAGGSGTRLWPLSRESNPKQLHALVGAQSLIAQTVERVLPIIAPNDVWIVTSRKYVDRVAEHVPAVHKDKIIAEPFALGTNLAVGLGAVHVANENPDAIIFVGWADSYIAHDKEFCDALMVAESVAGYTDGVVLGVKPTYPATGYGYIEMGEAVQDGVDARWIVRFEEKPDQERAEQYLRSGNYLWNPGISVWRVSRLMELMLKYKPDHYAALKQVARYIGTPHLDEAMNDAFEGLDREAIDTAILERADSLATVPVDLGWSDVGSWSALKEVLGEEGDNVTRGRVITVDTSDCLIYGQDRLIGTLGISGLVIVDAGDAILVARKEDADRLKDLHNAIKAAGHMEYI